MKHTKKLIPAIGMLLLSACMLVTSTFAWFSMNDTVTANGMKVSAAGDQIYLQIVSGTTGFSAGAKQVVAAGEKASATLKPVNVKESDKTAFVSGSDFIWVTAAGQDAEVGTAVGAYEQVTGAYDSYYLKNIFKIRLDPTAGATTASGPLTVSGVNFTKPTEDTNFVSDNLGDTVSVLVVCGEYAQLWTQTSRGVFAQTAGDSYLAGQSVTVEDEEGNEETYDAFVDTNGTGVSVDIYVFFNGDHEFCTLKNLNGAKQDYPVEVHFTVEGTADSD